jgi:outer membrane biosynthesis protein TonB
VGAGGVPGRAGRCSRRHRSYRTGRTTSTSARARKEEPPKIIRKSGGVFQGRPQDALSRYPPLAKAARVSGSVVVEVTVDEAEA